MTALTEKRRKPVSSNSKQRSASLQSELEQTRTTLSSEQKALKTADLEIQKSALELRELEKARQGHERELSTLHTERKNYLTASTNAGKFSQRRSWRHTGLVGNPG